MAKNVEVYTLEDNWDYIALTKKWMGYGGHTFIGASHNLDELSAFLNKELGIIKDIQNAVFLLDANWHGASSNGVAGREAIDFVRSFFGMHQLKLPWLVGRSGYNILEKVDYNWLKSDYQIQELPKLIDELPRR